MGLRFPNSSTCSLVLDTLASQSTSGSFDLVPCNPYFLERYRESWSTCNEILMTTTKILLIFYFRRTTQNKMSCVAEKSGPARRITRKRDGLRSSCSAAADRPQNRSAAINPKRSFFPSPARPTAECKGHLLSRSDVDTANGRVRSEKRILEKCELDSIGRNPFTCVTSLFDWREFGF